jgi:hydrogenase maturation protease
MADTASLRTIVVGLGNPVLGDDGVGWRVVDEVEALLEAARSAGRSMPEVELERLGVGGLRLMEFLTGFEVAILVDAAEFPDRPAGEVRSWALEDLAEFTAGHLDSAHDASLVTALALGRGLGASLPDRIHTITIQAHRTDVFSEQLSPEVAAAVPEAAQAVIELLAGRPASLPSDMKGRHSAGQTQDHRPGSRGGRFE